MVSDKAISDLIQATQITNEDLFVLEQSGEAKKLKGATLLDFITLSVVSVTVTTLPAGSSATAIYDKSSNTLALGIPRGDKGEPGGGGGQPAVEIDLSDSFTMDSENPFVSDIGIGYNKSVGEKIKQAALAGSAKVTVSLKVGVGEPEKVTLPMFGTQSMLNDGMTAYSLTGTYVWAGMLGLDIMIATTISDNSCTVVKHIAPWHQKPIYDPVDKPDTTPDGAFLRWNSEQKKWVAETVPAAEGGTF